jgi:endonuclease III
MAATLNKQQLLTQVQTLLKKKLPAQPEAEADTRAVLDEVIYAIVRESTMTSLADDAYARLKKAFFDWNDLRVSSIQEAADVMVGLPEAGAKAKRIIEFLQEHFERTYSFVLEDLEKKGLKQAAKQLARYKDHGVSDFVVAWVTQRSLGGHAIPLDDATIRVLQRLSVLDEGEIEDLESTRGTLEHYIPKTKGPEFTELVVQHATTICLPEVPLCSECPLLQVCPVGQENTSKAKPEPKTKPKSR